MFFSAPDCAEEDPLDPPVVRAERPSVARGAAAPRGQKPKPRRPAQLATPSIASDPALFDRPRVGNVAAR